MVGSRVMQDAYMDVIGRVESGTETENGSGDQVEQSPKDLKPSVTRDLRSFGNCSTLSPESFYHLHPCKRPALLY